MGPKMRQISILFHSCGYVIMLAVNKWLHVQGLRGKSAYVTERVVPSLCHRRYALLSDSDP